MTLPYYQGPAERELGGVRRPAVLAASYPQRPPSTAHLVRRATARPLFGV